MSGRPRFGLWLLAVVRTRLAVPLYRNGYALIASSLVTSVAGLAYWVIAAQTYSASAVGVSSALISAMTLLAAFAQLNLKGALNRFLPRAGPYAQRFVTRSYLLALAAGAVAGVIFLAGIGVWTPRLQFITDKPLLALFFVASTMGWTIFVLQDSVFAGIRQAGWVPVENLVFSVAKIVLLVALTAAIPATGVFVSWSLPAIALAFPVTWLLFRRLIPRHVRETRGREEPPGTWGVARYAAPDYLAYIIWAGTISVLPLIVLQQLGAKASAYFFVAWSIAFSLYLISSSMGMSLLAEGSLEPEELEAHRRKTVAESARLVIPGAIAVIVGAPLILGLMGGAYSAESVSVLRLLALSSVPFIIVAAEVNVQRVQNRMRLVVGTFAAVCALVLALGLPLMEAMGITGLGVAWLVAQTAVAGVILVQHVDAARRAGWREKTIRALGHARTRVRHWRAGPASAWAIRGVLHELRQRSDAHDWRVHRRIVALNDIAIAEVGPPGGPAAVVKVARSAAGDRALGAHARALLELEEDPRIRGWSELAPRVLARGRRLRRRFLVESYVPGMPAEELLGQGAALRPIVDATVAAIRPLHKRTASTTAIDEAWLSEWVDEPLGGLRETVESSSRLPGAARAVELVGRRIRDALAGKRLVMSRVHGDLCLGNVRLSADGTTVEGIVDWESASSRGIPALDLLHLVITSRMSLRGQELGQVVAEMLEARGQDGAEHLLLLTWLHHVNGNLTKSTRYGGSLLWFRRNVEPVLATVLSGAGAEAADWPLPAPGFRRPAFPAGIGARVRALPGAIRAADFETVAPIAGVSVAMLLWAVSLGAIHPRAMNDLGLVSVLPVTFFAAIALLTVSFIATLRRPRRTALLAAHVIGLIVMVHATPAIVYDTLRYAYAWKHLGIVDYIVHHGGVDPSIQSLSIYHNWPGFFGLWALFRDLGSVTDLTGIATWAPVFNNLLDLAAVVFVFSALTRDRRVIWIGSWLFFIANWVGQDYFSPQAFAYFLYLVVIGCALRWLGPVRMAGGVRSTGRFALVDAGRAVGARIRSRGELALTERNKRALAVTFIVLALVVIAASHALTSAMVTIALAALVLSRVCTVRSLPIISAAIAALWAVFFAYDYVSVQAASTLASIQLPWTQAGSNLTPLGHLSGGQQVVATIARLLVVSVGCLAIVGGVRQWLGRNLNRTTVVLAASPLLLFGIGSYDGEILFRIYLFSVPFLALLAAHAFVSAGDRWERRWTLQAVSAVGCLALGAAFLFAYYGKEHENYFTPEEVSASDYLYSHAPTGSLLIDGTTNYPRQFAGYERFAFVTLAQEPPSSQRRITAHPARVLTGWMSDPKYTDAFLILTRSQTNAITDEGLMAQGSLGRIQRGLLASPRFRVVYRNRDAVIFTLRGGGRST